MSTRDELNKANEEYGGGNSNFFKFEKSGVYKLRLLTKPIALATHFFGKGQGSHVCYGEDKGCPFHGPNAPKDDKGNEKKPSVKFITYVVDRSDGNKIKLGELPYSVLSIVADLEENEDWKFDGYPMPYDITVTYDKDNTDPKQIYKTLGSPTRSEIPEEVTNALMERITANSPAQFVQKRKDNELEKQKFDGTWEREQERRQQERADIKAKLDEVRGKKVDEDGLEYPEPTGEIPW